MAAPDAGGGWRAHVEGAIAAHRAKYGGWKKQVPPPQVSLRELGLPERVLQECLEPKDGGACPGDASTYLDALAAKGTASSAQAVFAWASRQPYPYRAYALLAELAPVEALLELQRRDPAKGAQSLGYALGRVRGQRLPEEARARIYAELRAQVGRPANGDAEALWTALHGLQPDRARDELAGLLIDGKENLYVLRLLTLEPRTARPVVKEALLRNVKKAETPGWLTFNITLLLNVGDEAVPALTRWVEAQLDEEEGFDLGMLLPVLVQYPASPGVDSFKAELMQDKRVGAFARSELERSLE